MTPAGASTVRFDYGGKTALVTGGTRGIGLAVARAFAGAGARVVAAGLPEPDAENAPGIEMATLNVTSDDSVDQVVNGLDSLDFLINCAGTIRRDEEFEIPVFEHVLEVNLTGTMRMAMACRPLLRQTRGAVVNIASMLSYFGGARVPAYAASKGGVAQLTKSLAIAWAAEGIRVNAVAPGWIETPFTQALREDPARSAAILGRTPMGRWGRVEDVTGAVLFLCSDAAGFITGEVLAVDGGYAAM